MQRPGNLSGGNWKDLALKVSRCELWIYPTVHLLSAVFSGSFLVLKKYPLTVRPSTNVFLRADSSGWKPELACSINFNVRKKSVQCYSWGCSGVDHSWRLTRDRVHAGQVIRQSQELEAECIIWLLSTLVLQLATNMRAVTRQVKEV